jgi:hypothetical protein
MQRLQTAILIVLCLMEGLFPLPMLMMSLVMYMTCVFWGGGASSGCMAAASQSMALQF